MPVTMELYQLKTLCMEMAALGVATFRKEMAPAEDLISQREAYRQFGEGRVKRWVSEGLITPSRNGLTPNSKRFYSRAELMSLNNGEKMQMYFHR